MQQKQTFKTIFLLLAILLAILPFILTFNALLTDLVERLKLYVWIQDRVVPIQSYLIGLLARPFGIEYIAYRDGMLVNGIPLKITWNCLGWQSLLLFGASLIMGLRKSSYTLFTKTQVVILGLFGIFWVNLLRIAFTVLLAVFAMPIFKIVFHDYLAAITTVAFLVGFWWFAYSFVLEERKSIVKEEVINV
ncbi:MAG: exosortase/archaeosortase family protein [Patescibacteria group bacterium]